MEQVVSYSWLPPPRRKGSFVSGDICELIGYFSFLRLKSCCIGLGILSFHEPAVCLIFVVDPNLAIINQILISSPSCNLLLDTYHNINNNIIIMLLSVIEV